MGRNTPGMRHVRLAIRSAARARAFYGGVLGLTEHAVMAESAEPLLVFGDRQGAPGTLLLLGTDATGVRGRWGVGGVHHVALGTSTREALLQWKRWLMDHGVGVSGPYDRGWFHSVYFADPDGQILEIATAGPGYTLDEPAEALGEQLIVPSAERMRGARDEAAIAAETHPEPVTAVTAEMALDGIHHVTGITDDMAAAHAFYTGVLGLRRVKQTVNQDDGATPHWFWSRHDGVAVVAHSTYTLFEWKGSTYRSRAGYGQLAHVAFRASSDDDLAAWREVLQALGVAASPVEDRGAYRSVQFRAPDGQLLELATDGFLSGETSDSALHAAADGADA